VLGGLISAITADEVELTLDDGRPAVISRRNFDDKDTDPSSVYSVGDRVEGAVLTREDPKKRVVLSRAWALKKQAWERVVAAAENNSVISGTVVSTSKRGVVVDAGVRGFVPVTHLDLELPIDLAAFVGQTFDFRILEVDIEKERLVLSRRSLLLKQQRKETHEILSQLAPGETRSGTVTSLTDYGAFVDLGGVNGLVHLSELSWHRVRHPSDVVSVGSTVEVMVLDVKVKKRRVSLSIRQLAPDPFDGIVEGSIIEGPVCRLVDFGAFVDVGGAEGLVHLSEIAEYRVSTPDEVVTPGEVVRAKVLSVDPRRRRIELSIRQAVSSEFDTI
jgi:small subunit ribosomal protein S1